MVIDFNRTVAYMCCGCGEMTFGNFSLFELSGQRGVSVKCDCGRSHLKILPKSNTEYVVSVRCMICDEEHIFQIPLQELLRQNCAAFSCPDLHIGLAYVGKHDAVLSMVQDNGAYIDEIVAACGLEHTGKNGLTMLKALDRIQEISDDGNLTCSCGSNTIDVDVLSDALVLTCCMCGAEAVFTADDIRNGNFSEIAEIIITADDTDTNEKE